MIGPRQVEAAARIGLLAREADPRAASAEALHELGALLPGDAAVLVAVDPFSGAHFPLAAVGCPPRTMSSFAGEFVATPWYRNVIDQPLPPSISDDDPLDFRHSWFYEERVRPAGFRDGMSGALWRAGRYVGMVHLSAERAQVYDGEARRLLAALAPALAAVADTAGRAGDAAGIAPRADAALVAGGAVVELPGRVRPAMLEDERFRRVLRDFEAGGGTSRRFRWPTGAQWREVALARHRFDHSTSATLVVALPAAPPPHGLTGRELDVLSRVALGWTNEAIARDLCLSPRTVHSHIEHILRKTGAASRAHAVALAVGEALLRPVTDLR